MLHVWLPLNGDLHNQGCSNVTVTNNGATVNTSGKIGSCYYFNASSYLYENTYNWTNFNTSQFSLCCWYKQPSPVASGNSQIICIGTSSGWNNIRIGLLRRSSSGYPMFSVSNGSSAVQYSCTATTFSLDTWNHIACTYDNGTIKIYLNGTLDKTYTTTIIPVLNSSQHLGIGAASNGAEKLTGYLNDVRIYDHCLSAAEVKEISQGLVLHYKLDDMSSTTVEDSSGYNHNGTRVGTISAYTDSPRYSQCMNLSAAASRINCGRGGMVTDAITVNFWANLPTVPSALSDTTGFVSCAESGGFRIQVGNNAIVRTIIYINAAYAVIEGSTAIQADTWYMITLVYDRMNSKLYEYINGIKDAELDVANNKIIGYNSGNVLWIGAEARSGTSYYSAIAEKVSDFRIYCTALDADAIRQLYEVSAKVDNKQNLHAFELVENNSKIQITKQGQVKCNELEEDEQTKFYQTDQIIETNEIIEL